MVVLARSLVHLALLAVAGRITENALCALPESGVEGSLWHLWVSTTVMTDLTHKHVQALPTAHLGDVIAATSKECAWLI